MSWDFNQAAAHWIALLEKRGRMIEIVTTTPSVRDPVTQKVTTPESSNTAQVMAVKMPVTQRDVERGLAQFGDSAYLISGESEKPAQGAVIAGQSVNKVDTIQPAETVIAYRVFVRG